MNWEVRWAPRALKDLGRLDPPTRQRVLTSVRRLAEGDVGDVKRLQGRTEFRLRAGDWRVFFRRDYSARIIQISRVVHRSDAY